VVGACRQKQGRAPGLQGAKQISRNQFVRERSSTRAALFQFGPRKWKDLSLQQEPSRYVASRIKHHLGRSFEGHRFQLTCWCEENATTALEVMSWGSSNPKWLIYLPPTMSPCEASRRDGLLEHPEDAFAYFIHEGVHKVVCEPSTY
jgi:hypothetical protein